MRRPTTNCVCTQTKKYLESFKSSSRLTDNVTYGLDYRLLYDKDVNFLRMQTDFYLSAELLKHTTFNFTLAPSNMKESYLLLKLKDNSYWFKVGRFYPAFGLRDPDHQAYVRTAPIAGIGVDFGRYFRRRQFLQRL